MKNLFSIILLCCCFTGIQAQPAYKQAQRGRGTNGVFIPVNKLSNNSVAAAFSTGNTTASGTTNATDSTTIGTGRVGIKTTSPQADLHVAGTVKISGSTTLDNLAGAGYRMVVVDSNGVLSTRSLPAMMDSTGTARYASNMRPDGYLTAAQVTQEFYFSSTTGNDNNPGTKNAPFQTLNKLSTLTLVAGSRIWLKGGDVFFGTLTIKGSGTAAKPIEVGSYGTQKAIVNAGNNEGLYIVGRSWLILHDLNLMGAGRKTGNIKNGLFLDHCNNSIVKDVVASGFQKSGVLFESCNHVTGEYLYAHTNGFAGIYAEGDYYLPNTSLPTTDGNRTSNFITIRNSIAENNAGDPTNLNNHSGNGILFGSTDNGLAEYCAATNNGYDMPRTGNGPVGIWAYQSDSIVIRKCISYKNKTSPNGADGGGFDLDGGCTHSIIEYCLSYDNEGAGYETCQYTGATLFSDNIIRYCISINDGLKNTGGFYIWGGTSGADFRNFTMHNCLIYSINRPVFRTDTDNIANFRFYNNVFLGNGNMVTGANIGVKFLSNLYYSLEGNPIDFNGHPTLAAWANATGQEKDANGIIRGMVANPNFAGPIATTLTDPEKLKMLLQYKPLPGSPLLGNGVADLSLGIALPLEDFYGNAIMTSSVALALMRTP